MPATSPVIVLASRSPRRVELLTRLLVPLNLSFEIDPADIDESPHAGESPMEYVRRCATEKALVVAKRRHKQKPGSDVLVIGADTTIDLDGQIIGQPADLNEAAAMLRQLSGRSHQVHTAVWIQRGDRQVGGIATAVVTMGPLPPELLTWYLSTGESLGKAGAYAAQGHGGALVRRIEGDLNTVIGLPVALLGDLVAKVSVSWKPGA